MPRYAMQVQYQGTHYHGWQSQPELPTVQQAVEQALSKVANEPITVICAGRTDSGVHAQGQVIHFDSEADRDLVAWHRGCNAFLPPDIAINWVCPVSDDFHARFKALARQYRYVIYNAPSRPALMREFVRWESRELDVDAMQQAADCLVGEHDFTSFRGAGCQARTAIRRMHFVRISRQGELVIIDIKANAFLLHMVRNIVGSLTRVGFGQEPVGWIREVLEGKDRRLAGATISPAGLSLAGVHYPSAYGLPLLENVGIDYYRLL